MQTDYTSTSTLVKQNTLEVDGNNSCEFKVSKQDEFGNEYFVKQVTTKEILQNNLDNNNKNIIEIQKENILLQSQISQLN